jgi:hypothetical protein
MYSTSNEAFCCQSIVQIPSRRPPFRKIQPSLTSSQRLLPSKRRGRANRRLGLPETQLIQHEIAGEARCHTLDTSCDANAATRENGSCSSYFFH